MIYEIKEEEIKKEDTILDLDENSEYKALNKYPKIVCMHV